MTQSADLSQHLEVTANVRAGRPRLRGTRITVDDIVILHLRLGNSLEQIVGKYNLSPASVHAALAYYYDHKAEIDKQIADDDAYIEAFKRNHPSLLREKLQVNNCA